MKSVKLSREHWDAAKRIGKGNAAEGIRRALDAASLPGDADTEVCKAGLWPWP